MWRAVQIYQKQEHRTSFKSSGVAQWYAVVARSRSASKTFSDQFWNLLFWREAQVQVKMYKTHRFVRAMFGSSVEKLVVLVVREDGFGPFSEVRMSKQCGCCGGKRISQSKCQKTWVSADFWRDRFRKMLRPRDAYVQIKM